jgi:predicted ATPase
MRITKLSLTNFRSFKETQTIEFAPVTLLFGPNSVGKSTVLMALFYLQQILDKGQCDPQRIDALGGKLVGGFKNLVHRRNLDESITIKIEYDKENGVGSSYDFLADLLGEDTLALRLSSPVVDAQIIALEFVISWAGQKQTAFVANYKIWFDGIEIAEVTSDVGLMQPQVTSLNYLHPSLLPDNHEEWLVECFDNDVAIHNALFDKVLDLKDISNPDHREISKGADRPFEGEEEEPFFTNNCFVSEFHELLNDERNISNNYESADNMVVVEGETLIHVPIGIQGLSGALPSTGMKLKSSLSLENEQQNEVFVELLSDILVAPLDNLKKLLNDSLCIGPLREIPDALHQANPNVEQQEWHNGLAAWDVLAKADSNLITAVDEWISSSDKLALGYGLAHKVEKRYAEIKRLKNSDSFQNAELHLNRLIAEEVTGTASSKVSTPLDESATSFSYTLYDLNNHIPVTPSDIGVGISQLMPLVVAALSRKKGIIAIEQPELHVHPRVQVAIADLLTQLDNSASFLIETHSEHLILRLLRRIRSTTEKTLSDGFKPVYKNDISIVYLEPSSTGVLTKNIEITEDGDFVDRWPGGFFDERDEELF